MQNDGKHQVLRDGLRSFGLDPNEWHLQEIASDHLVIHHLTDSELRLFGRAYAMSSQVGSQWEWSEISIASI